MPNRPAGELFPEYYLIYPKRFNENIRCKFDEWVYTLKNSVVKEEFSAAGIQDAGTKLNVQKMTADERISYDDFIKMRRVHNSEVKSAQLETEIKWQGVVAAKNAALAEKDRTIAELMAKINGGE